MIKTSASILLRGYCILLALFLIVTASAQNKKIKHTPRQLYRMADEMITTTITSKTKPNGDVFLQRNMNAYLDATVFQQKDQQQYAADYGHDHKDKMMLDYLNRPHPSVRTLRKYFTNAAREFNTPQRLLEAIAMLQSNWTQMGESMYGSYGIMGLVENQFVQHLTEASQLLNVPVQQIKDDPQTNIRAAAALLATFQKGKPAGPIEAWFEATKKLTGLHDDYYEQELARRIYDVIHNGARTISLWREIIEVTPMQININNQLTVQSPQQQNLTEAADYGGAILNLTTCNFNSRNGAPIQYYFVHYIAVGTYEGAISWFKNCTSQVSAHYVVRNTDGQITQVVMEANRAWSQGVNLYNDRGIGTEHDVISSNLAMWYSDPMLTAAGNLANNVCDRRSIPKQRAVAQPGINGHSDVKSTSCPNMTTEVWNLFLGKVNAAAGNVTPARPVLYTVANPGTGSGLTASWKANTESNLAGYRLYYATNDALTSWALAADETTLTATTTQINLNSSADFKTIPSGNVHHFRLVAVGTNAQSQKVESQPSDVYSRSSNVGGQTVLIVDGFDRINGSYTGANHSFATNYFKALRDSRSLQISTVANERVADGTVNLSNYQLVVWFMGDESTDNETFATGEQTKLQTYLEGGGKLLVSGSEIAWDIDNNGSAADKAFINNYLKAKYAGDGASNYTPATGIASTAFAGLNIPFGITYPEDFPDNITTNGGSSYIMTYAVAGANAGVAYKGTFGASTTQGGVVYVSFPLETSSLANHTAFTQSVLNYFDVAVPPVAVNDTTQTNKGIAVTINVLNNDQAGGAAINAASVAVVTAPANGSAAVNTSTGQITYTPNASFTGVETFTYRVADVNGTFSAAASVRITVINPTPCVNTGPEITAAHPKRDMRGVWISTVSNIDWPSSRTATPAVQMAELKTMLDSFVTAGINAVFFQARPESDALYVSSIEPWSYYLTGTQGTAPSPLYDPLSFLLTEAHARGIEVHAWLNPYRAKQSTPTLASNHVAVQHPDWTFVSGTVTYLNPGLPMVRQYVTDVVADIASRYNVDGIHFDDYFYPYGGMGSQDASTYSAYNPSGLVLADWRRNNVNQLITMVYDRIQQINTQQQKNIRFGVSPFGIWKSGVPAGITGLSSYDDIYCDPIAWLQAGKVDYLAPQLYWGFGGGQDYAALNAWWDNQAATYNRHLYPGLGLYRLNDSNWPASTIQNQVDENRKAVNETTLGQLFFAANDLLGNHKNIKTLLQQNQYRYKSVPPAMPWKDGVCPVVPSGLTYQNNKLSWNKPAAATDGDVAKKYIVYRFNTSAEAGSNVHDGTKILTVTADTSFTITQAMLTAPDNFFVVSALDKNNNESVLSTALNIIGDNPCTPTQTNVIVDAGSPGFSISAGWLTSTATAGYQGNNYYHDNNVNKGSAWVSYSPQVGGVYDVYTWHVTGTNRATNALFRINHAGGTTDVLVNQQLNNASWVYLGRYTFTSTIANKVQLRNDNTNGVVIADAVRFALAGCPGGCITPLVTEKIVDDVNAVFTGTWTAGANAGYYGTGYKHDAGTGQGTKTATYIPNVSETGSYELFAYYIAGTNRASNALVQVNHMSGQTNVTLNQRLNGSTWVSLGTFNFAKGTANNVVLKNDNANGVVIADAFRWVYKGCTTTTAARTPNYVSTEHTEKMQKVVAYPNPFTTQLKLQVKSKQTGLMRLRIIDASGRVAGIYTQQLSSTTNAFTIDVSKLMPGIYFAEAILPDGEKQIIKLTRQ